jgi:hypothetical protein
MKGITLRLGHYNPSIRCNWIIHSYEMTGYQYALRSANRRDATTYDRRRIEKNQHIAMPLTIPTQLRFLEGNDQEAEITVDVISLMAAGMFFN